jgi:putative ABC transport system ATP-binding protein
MAYIEFKNVSKEYQDDITVKALKKANFEIEKGDVVAVIGPSGSGKTTLLNILGLIDVPTSGEVLIDGVLLNKLRRKKIIAYRRKNIGFIFQDSYLVKNLTVKENVEVTSQICKDPQDVDQVMRKLALGKKKDEFLNNLSSSEVKKIDVARAIVKNPKILLCDETLDTLDEKSMKQVIKLIESINKKQKTTVFITSHNNDVIKVANKVIIIENGNIKEVMENKKAAGDIMGDLK